MTEMAGNIFFRNWLNANYPTKQGFESHVYELVNQHLNQLTPEQKSQIASAIANAQFDAIVMSTDMTLGSSGAVLEGMAQSGRTISLNLSSVLGSLSGANSTIPQALARVLGPTLASAPGININPGTLAEGLGKIGLSLGVSVAAYNIVQSIVDGDPATDPNSVGPRELISLGSATLGALGLNTALGIFFSATPAGIMATAGGIMIGYLINNSWSNIESAIRAELDGLTPYIDVARNVASAISANLISTMSSVGASALDLLSDALSWLGGQFPDWFTGSDVLNPPKVDPLVIDLNGNGMVDLISVGDSRVNMDLDANGYAERIAWVAPSDGLLAMDRNNNGVIDGLSDLFGNATTDGFVVLKTLDSNNDNKITVADAQFGKLRVWQDLNGDGIAQSTEVKTLAQHGITEISLNRTTVNQFVDGTRIAETAAVTTTSGSKSISSVYFARETLLSEWQAPAGFTVSQAASKLPGLKGYGEVKDLDAAMTLNGALLTQVQSLVTGSAAMTGAQIKAAFENILYKWTGAEAVAAGSRGAYIDAKHLTVIEKFYGAQFTQMIGNVAEHNPNAWQAPELEKLYANMLGSMLLQFGGQIAIAQSILANNPEAMTASPFWPLALLSEGTEAGLAAALNLIGTNAPADGSKDAYFEKLYTVLARGAAVNLYDGDPAAAKAGFATLTDAVTAHWLGAYLDGYVTTLGTSAATTLTGTPAKDLLVGLAGNDVLVGDGGDDILIGGTGNDTLQGGGGNDRYYYRIGDGVDLISETSNNMGDDDRVYFGEGLTVANTRVAFVDLKMVLTFTGVTGSLTVERQDAGGWRGMESFVFGDGTVKTRLELMQMGIEQQEASGAAVITGTTWNNVFRGNSANNTFHGLGGDDVYYYNIGGGNDIISDIGNNTGEDRLYLGAGLNKSAVKVAFTEQDMTLTFTGVTGSITLREANNFNGSGIEWVHFNDGTVWNMAPLMDLYIKQQEASGAAIIHGTGWDNVLRGNSANNTLKGYTGNDTYYFSAGGGNDIIDEGSLHTGNADRLILGTGLNTTNLQIARNAATLTLSFTGQAGSVQLYREDDVADRGVEIITFGNGVTWGRAELYQAYITQEQNKGAATLMGFGLTNDTITGSAIANTIYGYGGNDTLYGMNGNDTLYGGVSFDTLFGGAGNDTLFGEADSDILNGGAGNDTLLGGAANDFFVFTTGANGTDTITDFENGIDKIDLRGMGLTYASLTIAQMGTGVKIIKTGSTDLDVTLTNFSLANVDTSDFLFT